MEDPHLLVAKLHRAALVRCAAAAGKPLNGLSVAAKSLGMSSSWKRTLRLWDATLGLTEKISEESIVSYLGKLDAEIARCGAHGRKAAPVHRQAEGDLRGRCRSGSCH